MKPTKRTIYPQVKEYTKTLRNGDVVKVRVRHDDTCGNGHNTFGITCDVRSETGVWRSGGCQHDIVAEHFPELAPFIKWHLTSTEGPMHYIANTVYHAEQGKLEYARSSAVWPEATLEQLQDKDALAARLQALLLDFQAAVEALGLVY
jgi:uncharacterized protein Usg